MGKSGEPPVNIIRVPTSKPAADASARKVAPKDRIAALTTLFRQQRFEEALADARAMTRDFPDTMAGWNITGAAARALGNSEEAEASFRQLEKLAPTFAGAPYNLGLVLADRGADGEAAEAYARALAIDPSMAQAHNNLGSVLNRLGDTHRALEHAQRAAALAPDLPEVQVSLGNVLRNAGRVAEAITAYRRALQLRPAFAKAHYNLGVALQEAGEDEEAIAAYREALKLEPDHELSRLQLTSLLMQGCDWAGLDAMDGDVRDLGVETEGVPPWTLFAVEDAPARQLQRARSWARRLFSAASLSPHSSPPLPARPESRRERLRIGYFGSDYHDHPGTRLISGLIRSHDRGRFEVHAFSYGAKRDDPYRRQMETSFDAFHDVAGQSDEHILELARSVGIDIAVDRQGYTTYSRTRLFRHRIAPVQVEFLGFPSTTGTEFIDYLVADTVVVPERLRAHYSERLIRLPHSYMPTDNQLPIASQPTTRADHGLPDAGFVFCCFNATYKIRPREFAIWMRLLERVEGSVLWLFRSNPRAERNLREQASRHGVDPARLVFAKRVPSEQHLERHAHADLFLDTFCMNAHTTTIDALWAGLPVLTKAGEQFAARVAASVIEAVGLPELVTHSAAEYEALALDLAQDRGRLAQIRARLAANRETHPLFDTQLYTRHLEAGFDAAYERFLAGLEPADISVAG